MRGVSGRHHVSKDIGAEMSQGISGQIPCIFIRILIWYIMVLMHPYKYSTIQY